jgi:hypothetical protein
MSSVAQDPNEQRSRARAAWLVAMPKDESLRDTFTQSVTDSPPHYLPEEQEQIDAGLRMEAEVTQSTKLKRVKASTPLLDRVVAMTSKDGQHNIVQSSATIRVPLMDVLAFIFCSAEQEFNKIMADEKGTRYQMLESKSECSVVYQYSVRNIRPFADRDFVLSVVYQAMESGGDGVISMASTEHAAATSNDNSVRATVTRLFRFSRVTPTLTRFTVTTTFDLRGSVPRFVSDTLTTPTAARAPLVALDYFIKIKKTAGFDAAGQDARALGQLLVHNTEPVRTKKGGEQLESKLHTFFDRTTVLRELADVYPWFPTMLIEVLRNVQHRPRTTKAKLADFTERDAQVTGRAMKMLMLSNATPDAAVDEVSREQSERKRRTCGGGVGSGGGGNFLSIASRPSPPPPSH